MRIHDEAWTETGCLLLGSRTNGVLIAPNGMPDQPPWKVEWRKISDGFMSGCIRMTAHELMEFLGLESPDGIAGKSGFIRLGRRVKFGIRHEAPDLSYPCLLLTDEIIDRAVALIKKHDPAAVERFVPKEKPKQKPAPPEPKRNRQDE